MKILMICDDYWHPGQIPIDGVAPLREQGFDFDIITDANEFNPKTLPEYPVILLIKSDQVSQQDKSSWETDQAQQAFVDYVEQGGGLVAVHAATVPGGTTDKLSLLLGCKFQYHPNACPVTVQPVKPHPVTEGVGMFCETDEHYRIEILKDDVDIIAASYSPPQGNFDKAEEDPYRNTQAWISASALVRTQGKGRVCVLTPGHLLPVWLNQHFQKMLYNAFHWCANE